MQFSSIYVEHKTKLYPQKNKKDQKFQIVINNPIKLK